MEKFLDQTSLTPEMELVILSEDLRGEFMDANKIEPIGHNNGYVYGQPTNQPEDIYSDAAKRFLEQFDNFCGYLLKTADDMAGEIINKHWDELKYNPLEYFSRMVELRFKILNKQMLERARQVDNSLKSLAA